jgi:uroporphyrinogen-III synthase
VSSLQGKRVLITRPAGAVDPLIERLAALGAVPLPFPTTTIRVDEQELARLDRCLQELHHYDWLVFTSQNAVHLFFERYERVYAGGGALAQLRLAAVGPATARSLEAHGAHVEVIPDEYRGDAIAGEMGDLAGKRVLLPRAHGARAALVEELSRSGASVDEILLYRSVTNNSEALDWVELERGVDYITFTSASTVHAFFELLGERRAGILSGAVLACIGPVTAAALQEYGAAMVLVAQEYTIEGLLQAMLAYEKKRKENV